MIGERISKIEYGLLQAVTASLRSEDPHTRVGCALENYSGRIIAIGYNGLKEKQLLHFSAEEDRDRKRSFFIHAETNSLSLVKKGEIKIAYLTHSPCASCCQNLAAHDVKMVFFLKEYAEDYKEILSSYEISCTLYDNIKNDLLKLMVKKVLNER